VLTSPTRSLKTFALLARIALGLVVAAWLLFGASWAALHWVIVPRIAQWQPDIERLASQRLGVEVRMGQIVLDTTTTVPSFTLHDVQLLDADQRPALYLQQVHASLSVSSVWRLGFEQLVIDGPVLEVRRTAEGRWQLGGLTINTPTDSPGQGNNTMLDWILDQSELAILNGSLRYTDETRPEAEPLVLTDISWVNRNQSNTLHMRLDARLPADWGGALSVQGELSYPLWVRRAGDWQQWKGQWFAELPYVNLSRLPNYANTTSTLGLQVLEGSGGARLWVDMIEGQLSNITLDMRLRGAALQWPGQEAPMAMSALSGRLHLDRNHQTINVVTEDLAFTTRAGVVWPGGNFRYSQQLDSNNALERMRFESNDLDALALSQLAKDMPFPATWQSELLRVAPQGRIDQLDIDWSQDQGGDALIRLSHASLNTQPWFDHPRMQFDQLRGHLKWTTQEGLHIDVTNLQAMNADVEASAALSWRQNPQASPGPGYLKLEARIERVEANRVFGYLPKTIGPNVVHYLKTSLKEGQAFNGRFNIEGDLAHFPFDQHPGQFEVSAQLKDVLFDYVPAHLLPARSTGWPALRVVEGELHIGPQNIHILNAKAHVARLPNLELPLTRATIGHYTRGPTTVKVSGPVIGSADDVLNFIQQSALGNLLNQALDSASASGPLQGELALDIPLGNVDETTVSGQVEFKNTLLRIRPDIPTLSQTQGTLIFNEQGFRVEQAKAQVLGGTSTIDAALEGTGSQRSLTVHAQGEATALGLTQDPSLSAYASLAQQLQGQTQYTLHWSQKSSGSRFELVSNLQGMGSQLPAPFRKVSAQTLPLRVLIQPLRNASPVRDELLVQLGHANYPWLAARYLREERQGQMHILRGAVGVNTRAPGLPASGVLADIQLDTLQTDVWSNLLEGGAGTSPSPWAPTSIALQARIIEAGAHTLNQVQLRANRIRNDWEAQVQSQEVMGRINWSPSSDQLPGRVQARLSRLHLQSGSGDTIDSLIRQDPIYVPAVDVVADDFKLDGRSLGQLEIQATNLLVVEARRPGGHEWRLQTLKLTTPEARLQASGNWASSQQDPSLRRTAMRMVLDIDDSGQLLNRFGMPGVIRGGQGKIAGTLGWVGSPLNFNKSTLAGELALEINRGQFLQAEPGVARLIGVLNLQTLPRRLALDFRDVFSEGFTFDFVRGNVQVAQGMARTNNLQMKGVTAAVLIEGVADVLHEKQDLTAVIIPNLSTGTATLVTTLINPITGISAFLGQFLLRQPLQEAGTRQFHITGSWSEPKITPVNRRNLPQNGGASQTTPSMSAP
jgi:uncharacterized protein YhdP